jgi:DNA-binding CsgD family transcriptional regulator
MSPKPMRSQLILTRSAPQLQECLVIMNLSLEPVGADAGAGELLRDRNALQGRRMSGALCIPKEIKDALKNTFPHGRRVHFHIGQEAFVGRTFLIQPVEGAMQPMIGLHIQRDSSVASAIDLIASKHGLSPREREALNGITIGLTSKQMAEQMKISPNTVKSYLRLIMIKIGATTRTGIVSKVLESSTNDSQD